MFVRGGYRKKRVAKRTYTKKSKKSSRKTPKVSNAVAAYVKKVVHKNIENKTVSDKNYLAFDNYIAQPGMNCSPLMPGTTTLVIPQGTGQSERVGNTITTRKLLLKYCLYPVKQDTGLNPQPLPKEVVVWIGYLKNNRMLQPGVTEFQRLFQDGNTASSPVGNLWDTMLPINSDLFHICRTFRHKMGNAVYTDYSGIKPSNYYINNDFKLNCNNVVDLTKYLNKTLKFDDATVICDSGLYMWTTAVNADGTTETNAIYSVGMNWTLRFDYEDA